MPPSSVGIRTIGAIARWFAVPIRRYAVSRFIAECSRSMTTKSKPASASSSTLSITGSFTHVPRAGPPGRASAARNRLVRAGLMGPGSRPR